MRFYSTNDKKFFVSLKDAVIRGLAPDNGLFMPERIPQLNLNFLASLHNRPLGEIALQVSQAFLGEDIPEGDLARIVGQAINFDCPLVNVGARMYSLELFHGPTFAFKDFGARFLAGLLGYFAATMKRKVTILVATSGDTGSAVANGFLDVLGVEVVVLYPAGKVSEIQERQFTTLGRNITALEVAGTFDDCQRLVKQAFADDELRSGLFLTSANSISVARLIPQTFYYFRAVAQLPDQKMPVVFSVPSGNFGNLTAGLIARRMGLPVAHFIAATNVNDIVPRYLKTGFFEPKPSIQTISNAMDVGDPSNFHRMLDLYEGDAERLRRDVVGFSCSDEETAATLREVLQTHHYLLDPHGAVAYLGLKRFLEQNRDHQGIFLETAHPAKFSSVVEKIIEKEVEVPSGLRKFLDGVKQTTLLSRRFEDFKKLLLERT